MMAWEDSTLPGVECPVPAGGEQTNPHWGDIFCLCMSLLGPDPRLFPITACIWDTHLIVCCLNVAVQAQTDPSLLFMSLCFFPQHWLFISSPSSLGKIFSLVATFTALQIVQETTKLCSRPTQLCCLWTWQSDRISFVETYLMRQICSHLWRVTRRAIVVPLVVLSEPRGNQSDFCPPPGQINRQGTWNKAPRIFMYATQLCQECGHGRWPLCIPK